MSANCKFTDEEIEKAAIAMIQLGTIFEHHLGSAIHYATANDRLTLMAMFPELISEYKNKIIDYDY